jgi:hypothetical protein
MSSTTLVVPAPLPDDPEDVRDALTIASTVWGRGERNDAITWIRRAADAAHDSGKLARAKELQDVIQAASNAARLAAAHPDPQEMSAEIFVLKTPLPMASPIVVAPAPTPSPNAVGTPMPATMRVQTPPPMPAVQVPKPSTEMPGPRAPTGKPSADGSGPNRAAVPMPPARGATPETKKSSPGAKVTPPRATPLPPVVGTRPTGVGGTITSSKSSGTMPRVPAPDPRTDKPEKPDKPDKPQPVPAPEPTARPLLERAPEPSERPSDSDLGISIALETPNEFESTTTSAPAVADRVTLTAARGKPTESMMASEDDVHSLDDEPGETVTRQLDGDERRLVDGAVAGLRKSSPDASGPVPTVAGRGEPALRTAVALRVRVYPSEAGAWVMPEQPGDTDGVSAMLVALDGSDLRSLFPRGMGRRPR